MLIMLRLAVHTGVRALQEIQSTERVEPWTTDTLDSLSHCKDVLRFRQVRHGCEVRIIYHFWLYVGLHCSFRFFERIAKTYRRESWDVMLRPLLTTWYACAQQLGDMELGVQLLIEMLAHGTYCSMFFFGEI